LGDVSHNAGGITQIRGAVYISNYRCWCPVILYPHIRLSGDE